MNIDRLNILSEIHELGAGTSEIVRLMALTVFYALFEGIGIGVLLPILEYIEKGSVNPDSSYGNALLRMCEILGLGGGHSTLAILLVLAFLLLAIRSLVQYARDIAASRLKFKIAVNIRRKAGEAFIHADFAFLKSHSKGELFSALTVESDRATEAIASRIVFLNATILFLIYLLLLFVLSPFLTLYTLPICIIAGFVFRYQGSTSTHLSTQVSEKNTRFGERISNYLHGILRIKMRAQESETARELGDEVEKIMASQFSIEKLRVLIEVGMHPVVILCAFCILYIATIKLKMTLAGLGIFMFVLIRLIPQLTLMNSLWAHMHGCLMSFKRLNNLIEEAAQHCEKTVDNLPFVHLHRGIQFENVHFRYSSSSTSDFAIRNVRFFIPKGNFCAIVGRSGSGKSTIVSMLSGFYRPQSGNIWIDNMPLQQYNLASLRRKIAYVPQEPFLFQDTIRNNITFGINPPVSDSEIHEALDKSFCGDFVSNLDNGLETFVGEQGNRLSQGQRQRLAIAAALAIKPEILILDEPTSALDSESEQALRKTLYNLKGSLTIFVIAHRFSTISHADQILLIDNGKLLKNGHHKQLLEESKLYKNLFETQIIV